ncbi:hypothetical protein K439DRAFT_1659338 [Ramaria rubella]|nr:hypothetical protein K439DRAFT_1659338 [Ramaria rubella]
MPGSPKERRTEPEPPKEASRHSKPTRNQLWKWCLRADAVAQCYIRDVMQLVESPGVGIDSDAFWWLGTVPCRSVKFVGMLVGAVVYEKRTIYTVDDGTDVVQCVHPHAQSSKNKAKPQSKQKESGAAGKQSQSPSVLEDPKACYEVGDILRVTGRVEAWRDRRQIVVNEIELCRASEEPRHWTATARLHRTYYSQPFIIPPLPPPPVPRTPVKSALNKPTVAPPSTASTVLTPSTTASHSSIHSTAEKGRIRLRHPSHLRSRDLIANTFKIYLKNYMDVLSERSHATSLFDNDSTSSVEESPTKRLKRVHNDDNAATPRPKARNIRPWEEPNVTPRPSRSSMKRITPRADRPSRTKGFTLSYLRRVPELADMARRVVEAEQKRRSREARQKQKEAARAGKTFNAPKQPPAESPSRKVKRLYTWTLRELHREGSIILHEDDAPVWELSAPAELRLGIWKASTRGDISGISNFTALSTLSTISSIDDSTASLDNGDISDPPLREESYIPLTPAMLMAPVITAIQGLMVRNPRTRSRILQENSDAYRGNGSQAVGPTAGELREYLSKVDARWENVGEYTIIDALELLKKEGKVYRIGKGRWELSID